MTSKQRAFLRKKANKLEPVYHVGKNGIDRVFIEGVAQALEARELIKLAIQDSSLLNAREAAGILAGELDAEPIQVIGKRFVLYKRNKETDRFKSIWLKNKERTDE